MDKAEKLRLAEISGVKIKAYCDLIEFEYSIVLMDYKGMAEIRNRARQIINNVNGLFKCLKSAGIMVKDNQSAEVVENYNLELWNTLNIIFGYEQEQLEALNILLEKFKNKENV